MWACADGGGRCVADAAEETITVEEAEQIESRLRAEIEALRRDLSAQLQGQHDRLLKLEAGEGSGAKKAEEPVDETIPEAAELLLANDLDAEGQDVELGGSTWDACLLVGAPCLGVWGSVAVCLCTLLNIAIQTIFVALVWANFLEKEFSKQDIEGFKAWRLTVAHDDRYTSLRRVSLAARVCGQDPTLELSNEQSAKVHLIRSYLPSLDPELTNPPAFSKDWMKTILDGSVMCLVAVSAWVLTVAKEVGTTWEVLGAVLALPFSRRLGVQVATMPTGQAKILSAGVGSRAFMVFVLLLRLSVAVALLAMGCLYLAYTSSMQDLLLNAVALECVMNIDELVYHALAPRRARQVLQRLLPLRLQPWRRRLRALDVKAVLLSMLLAGTLVLIGMGAVQEQVDNLKDAHSLLCGGSVDFAASLDPLRVFHSVDTSSFDGGTAFVALGESPQDLAVQELIDGTPLAERMYSLTPGDYSFNNLELLRTANIITATTGLYTLRSMLNCHDALDLPLQNASDQPVHIQYHWNTFIRNQRVWLHYLRALPGSSQAGQSCADFRHLCSEQLVKAVCPQTCNCNSLLRGSLIDQVDRDCPMGCRRDIAKQEAASTTCEDAILNNASDPKWQRLVEYAQYFGGPFEQQLLNQSCAALFTSPVSHLLCENPSWLPTSSRTSFNPAESQTLKLMTYVCPVTCNCGGRGGPESAVFTPRAEVCPNSCSCPWDYPTVPVLNGSTCTVPHYVPGYSLPPIDADAKCCYLMGETSRILRNEMAGANDPLAWNKLEMVFCHACYAECLKKLWSLRVVENPSWSFPSLFYLIAFGSTQIPANGREILCRQYDSGTTSYR